MRARLATQAAYRRVYSDQKQFTDIYPAIAQSIDADAIGSPPEAFEKPKYGTPAYAIARAIGWISEAQETADESAWQKRRDRSLKSCWRYRFHDEDDPEAAPEDMGLYVPEMSEAIEHDRRLTPEAKRLARLIVAETYRFNRGGRTIEATVGYFADRMGRCGRSVQRYMRQLYYAGYVHINVLVSDIRMCEGLQIVLKKPLFPWHHRKKWPAKRTKSGVTELSDKYGDTNNKRKQSSPVTLHMWATRCMNGAYRAFMKTDPLLSG